MNHSCDLDKLKEIFDRGLCIGLNKGNQVCIEGAIALACDGDLKDTPECVDDAVRSYSIRLNDSRWSSPRARADGMWDLALIQLGTKGKLNEKKFAAKLAELTIRRVVPIALRAAKLEKEALRCEREGSAADAADAAHAAAYSAADAAHAAAYSADAADAAAAAHAAAYSADAAADAAHAAAYSADANLPLVISAQCAVEAIRFALEASQ